tara:strand:+ start:18941 stop:19651 length:711 start_codon:yes stop_codon:yes gene_type:complete
MSLTKVEHVLRAYSVIRISGLTSSPNPSEIELGLSELEDMMAEFKTRNICSSYFFEDEPDPNTNSEIDPVYNNATQKCLAVRLAPYFGKEALPSIQKQATQALSNWSARSGKTNMIKPSNRQPRGSGNTFRFPTWVRFYRFEDGAPISCDTFNLKIDEINFFSVDFNGYLLDGATILSFTLDVSSGIEVISSSESGGFVNLECKGLKAGYNPVTITIATSTGRVNPEKVNFNINEV